MFQLVWTSEHNSRGLHSLPAAYIVVIYWLRKTAECKNLITECEFLLNVNFNVDLRDNFSQLIALLSETVN